MTLITETAWAGRSSLRAVCGVVWLAMLAVFPSYQPSGFAQVQPVPSAGQNQNPAGIMLELRCMTNIFMAGDEIPVEFVISNGGAADYKYANRTYDRGGRMPEYQLTARTAAGGNVPDPRQHFLPGMIGGLYRSSVLRPGQSFTKVIPLNLWAVIREPGRYEVIGDYNADAYGMGKGTLKSAPLEIIVQPRTPAEMGAYVRGLTNQIASRLAGLAAERAAHPGGLPSRPPDMALRQAVMKLMYTGAAEGVPTLLQVLYEGDESFWAVAALADYVPHTAATRQALLEAAGRRGLNGSMERVLAAHEFEPGELKPVTERALAADQREEWRPAVWLALHDFDDDFTPRLIAIAQDDRAGWDTRSVALRVLTYHRSDAGVAAIKSLLKDPPPEMLEPLYETMANGYAGLDKSPHGRPLRPEDFSAEDLQPLIGRLLASTNQALQSQLSGALLAKWFGSDALTEKLVTLATNSEPTVKVQVVAALALNRTDEGVRVLKMLLNDSDPQVSGMAAGAIRAAYTQRWEARGRPLRADDFDAKFQVPEAGKPE